MKKSFLCILMLASISLHAALDPLVLRKQVFGDFGKKINVDTFSFASQQLAVFNNSYVITMEEYHYSWNRTKRDSTHDKRVAFLGDLVLLYQKAFEAMDKQMDTSTAFQLEFLKYKQTALTPYLNEGYTRVEAEELPAFKFMLRQYYCGILVFELMNMEVWTKANRDTEAQKNYYNNHIDLYQGQNFETSRTKVIHDYQKELESNLDARVREKFTSRMNVVLSAKL
jgi:hypothetical protein